MAPSSNPPPSNHNASSPLNALLQKKAREAREARAMGLGDPLPLAEASSSFSHAVVDILPRPRTKMNRSQNEETFEEGDYCPISPEEIKQAKRLQNQAERAQRRQKLVIQKRRIKKRRKVFLQRLKRVSNLVSFFLLSVLIWVFLANPMWLLRANSPIYIHHARFITLAHLSPFIKNNINKPIFDLDPQAIEKAVKKRYRIVEHLYIRRSLFPPKLDFTLIEKTPFAAIYTSPSTAMSATKPVAVATFESDTNHYDVVRLAPYTYKPEYNTHIPKIVMPAGYRLTQTDWQHIDGLLDQLKRIQTLPFQTVEMLPIPISERDPKQKHIPLMAIIHYPTLVILAGPVDTELNQRVARLPMLVPKIKEMGDTIQAVDLRWSEQITFIKKGVELPYGVKTLSQKTEELNQKMLADTSTVTVKAAPITNLTTQAQTPPQSYHTVSNTPSPTSQTSSSLSPH